MLNYFKFHFAFVGFTCRVVDNKVLLGFWKSDKFVEESFDSWDEAVDFSRRVTIS